MIWMGFGRNISFTDWGKGTWGGGGNNFQNGSMLGMKTVSQGFRNPELFMSKVTPAVVPGT
jgi:hypothetical protein